MNCLFKFLIFFLHIFNFFIVSNVHGTFGGINTYGKCELRQNFVKTIPRYRRGFTLDCEHKGITKIPKSEVDTRITVLKLSHNILGHIREGAFAQYPNLKSLDLKKSGITHVDPNAFRGLHNLQYLYLSNNRKLTELPSGLFRNLKSIKTITLEGCGLHSFPRDAIGTATNQHLQELSLGNNNFPCDCSITWLWKDYKGRIQILPRNLIGFHKRVRHFAPLRCYKESQGRKTWHSFNEIDLKHCHIEGTIDQERSKEKIGIGSVSYFKQDSTEMVNEDDFGQYTGTSEDSVSEQTDTPWGENILIISLAQIPLVVGIIAVLYCRKKYKDRKFEKEETGRMTVMKDLNTPELYLTPASQIQMYADYGQKKFSNHHLNTDYWYNIAEKHYLARTNNQIEKHVSFKTPIETTLSFQQPCFENEYEKPCDAEPNKSVMNEYLTVEQNQNRPFDLIKMKVPIDSKELNGKVNINSSSNIIPLKSNLKGKNEIGPLNVCDKSVSDLDDFIMYASMSLPDIPKDIHLEVNGEIHAENKTNSAKKNKDTYNNIGDLSEYKSPALYLSNVDLQQRFEATDDTYQSLNINQTILTNVYQPSEHPTAPCNVSMDLEDHESNHSINDKYVTIQVSSNQIEKESNIVIDIDNCYEDVYDAAYDKIKATSSTGSKKDTSISDLHSVAIDSFTLSNNHETTHNVTTRNVSIGPEHYESNQSVNDNNPNNVTVQVRSNQFDSQRNNLVDKDSNTVIDINNCYDDVYDTAYDKIVPHSSNGFRKTTSFSVLNFDPSDHFISTVDYKTAHNAATHNVSIDLEDYEPSHCIIDNSRENVPIQVSTNGFESQQNDQINNETNIVTDTDKSYDDFYDAAYDKIVPVLSNGFRKDTNISDCNSIESDSFTSSVNYENKINYDGDVQENNGTIIENKLGFQLDGNNYVDDHDYQNYPGSFSACESYTETSSVIETDNDSLDFQSDERDSINHKEYGNYPANSQYIEEAASKVGFKKFRSNSTNLGLKSFENEKESIADEGNMTTSKEVSILSDLDLSGEGGTSHTHKFSKDFRSEFQNDSSNEDEMEFMNEYETSSISDDGTNATKKSDDEFVNDSRAESLASYTNDIMMIKQSESIYNMDANINTKALQTRGKEDEKLESAHQFCNETNISDGSHYILADQRYLLSELAVGNDNQYSWEVYKNDQFDVKKYSRLNAVTSYSECLKEVNDNNKETFLQEKDAAIKNKEKEDMKDIYVVNQKSLQNELKSNVIFKGVEHVKNKFTVNAENFEQKSNNDIDKNIDTESQRDSKFYSCDSIFENDEYDNQTEDKTQWRKLSSSISPANYKENKKDDLDLSGFDDELCSYIHSDDAESNFADSHKIEQNQLTGRLSKDYTVKNNLTNVIELDANTDNCSSEVSTNVDEPVTTYNVAVHSGQQMQKPVLNTTKPTENRIKADKLIFHGNFCDLEELEKNSYHTQVDENLFTDKSSNKYDVVINVKRDIQKGVENDNTNRICHSTTTSKSYKNRDNVVCITNPKMRDNVPADKTTLNNRFCTSDQEKGLPSDHFFLQKQNDVSISEPSNVSNLTEHFMFDEAPLVNTHSNIHRGNENDKRNGITSLENNSDFLRQISIASGGGEPIHLTQIMVDSKCKALQKLDSVNLVDTESGYKMGEKVKSHNTVNTSYVAENVNLFLGRQKSVLDEIDNQHHIHDLSRNLNSTVFITEKNESLHEKIDRWYNYNSESILTGVNQESDTGNIKNTGDQCLRKSSFHVIETPFTSVYMEKDSCMPSSVEPFSKIAVKEPHKALSREKSSLKSFEREGRIISPRTGDSSVSSQDSSSYKSKSLLALQEDEHSSPLSQGEPSSALEQKNSSIILSNSSPSVALESYEEDLDLNIACDLSSQYSEISSGDTHKCQSKINTASQSMVKDNVNENFADDTGLLLTTTETTNKTNLHEKPLSGESSSNELDKTTSNSSSEKTIVDDSKNNQTLFEKVKQVKRLLWLVNLSNKNKESPSTVNERKKVSLKSKLSLEKISDRGSLVPKNNVHQTLTVANTVDLLLLQQKNTDDKKSQRLDNLNENEPKLEVSTGSRVSLTAQEKHDPKVVVFDNMYNNVECDNKYNEQELSKLAIQSNNRDSIESINLISFESDASKELFNDSFDSFCNSTDDFRKSVPFSAMLQPTNQSQSTTNLVQPLISNAFAKKLAALYINKTIGKRRETLSSKTSESSLSLTFDSQSSVESKTDKFQDTSKVTSNTSMSILVRAAEKNSATFEDLTIDNAETLPHDQKHTEIDYPIPNYKNLTGSKILQEDMNMPMVEETDESSDVLANDSTEIDKISQRKKKKASTLGNKACTKTDLSSSSESTHEDFANKVCQSKCFEADIKSDAENQNYPEMLVSDRNLPLKLEKECDTKYNEQELSKLVIQNNNPDSSQSINLISFESGTSKDIFNDSFCSVWNTTDDFRKSISVNAMLQPINQSQSTTNVVQPLVNKTIGKQIETQSKEVKTSENCFSSTVGSKSSVGLKTYKFQDKSNVSASMPNLFNATGMDSVTSDDLTVDTAEKGLPYGIKHTQIDYPTPDHKNVTGTNILREDMIIPRVKETHKRSNLLANDGMKIYETSQGKTKYGAVIPKQSQAAVFAKELLLSQIQDLFPKETLRLNHGVGERLHEVGCKNYNGKSLEDVNIKEDKVLLPSESADCVIPNDALMENDWKNVLPLPTKIEKHSNKKVMTVENSNSGIPYSKDKHHDRGQVDVTIFPSKIQSIEEINDNVQVEIHEKNEKNRVKGNSFEDSVTFNGQDKTLAAKMSQTHYTFISEGEEATCPAKQLKDCKPSSNSLESTDSKLSSTNDKFNQIGSGSTQNFGKWEISTPQNKTYKKTDLSTSCQNKSEGAGNEVYQSKCLQTDAKSEAENQNYRELFEDNGHQYNESKRSGGMIYERYGPRYERNISRKSQVQLLLKDSIFTQIKGKYQMTQNLEGSISRTESTDSFGESGSNQPFDYKDYIPCNVTLHSTNLSQSTTNLVQPLVSNAFSKRLLGLYSNNGMNNNTGSTNSNTKDSNSDLVVTTDESEDSFKSVASTVQNMAEMDSQSVKNQSGSEEHSEEIQVDSLDKNSRNLDAEIKGSAPFTKSSDILQSPMEKSVSSSLSNRCREIMTMDKTIRMLSNTRKSSDKLRKTTTCSSVDKEISLTGSVAFTNSQKSICSTRSDGHHKMLEYNSKDENLERLHRDNKNYESGRTEKEQQIPLDVTNNTYTKEQFLQEKYGVKIPRQCSDNKLIKDYVLSQIKEKFKLHNEIGIKLSATDPGIGEYGGQRYNTPVPKTIAQVKEHTIEKRLREIGSDSLIVKDKYTMSHFLDADKSDISLNSYTCSVRLFDTDHLVAELHVEEEEVNKAKRMALAHISKRYSSLIIANAKAIVYEENLRKRSINNECDKTLTLQDILKRSDSKHIQEVSRKTILPANELLIMNMKQTYDSESYPQDDNKDQRNVNYPTENHFCELSADDIFKIDHFKVNTEVDTSNEFNSVDSRTNHEHHVTKCFNEVIKNSNISVSDEKMTRNLEKMKIGSANEICNKINSTTVCTKQEKRSILMEKKLNCNIQKTFASDSRSLNTNLGEGKNKMQNVTTREAQIEGPVKDSVLPDVQEKMIQKSRQSNAPDKQEIKVHNNAGIRLDWKYPSEMEESNISHVPPLSGNKALAHLTVDSNAVKRDRVIEFADALSRRIIANTKAVMQERNRHVSVDKRFDKLMEESHQNENLMEVDGDTSRQTSNKVEFKMQSEGTEVLLTKDSNKDGTPNNICIQKDGSIPLLPDLHQTINYEDKDYERKLDKIITNGSGTQQDLKMSLLNHLKDTYETNKTENFVKETENESGNEKCKSLKQKYGAIIPRDSLVEEIMKDSVLTQIQDKFIERSRIMNVKDSKNDKEEAKMLNYDKQSTSIIVTVEARLIENEKVIHYCNVNEDSKKNIDTGKITVNIVSQFVESIIQNCKRKLELAQQKKVIRKHTSISKQKPRWRYLHGEEIPPNSMVARLIKDCVMVQIKEKYGTLDIDSQGSFSDTEITSKKKIQLRGKYNDVVVTNSEVLGHCIEYDQSRDQFYDSDKHVILVQEKLTGNTNEYPEKSIFEKIDYQESVSNTEVVDKEKLESMNISKTVILHSQNPAEKFIQNSFLTQMKENFFTQKSGKPQLKLNNKGDPRQLTNNHEKRLLKNSTFTQTKDVPLSNYSNVNPNHKRNYGKLYSQDKLNQKPSPLNAGDIQDTQRRTSYQQEQVGKSADNGKNLEKCIQSLSNSKINKHSSASCKGSTTNPHALKDEFNNVSRSKNALLPVNSRHGVCNSVSSANTVILNPSKDVEDAANKLSLQYSIIQVDSPLMKRNCALESQNIEVTQGHVDITSEEKDENERGQYHLTSRVTFADMTVNAGTNEFPRRDLRKNERPKEQFQVIQCNNASSKTADVKSNEKISPSNNLNDVTNNENLSVLDQVTDTLSPENLKEVKVKDTNSRNSPVFSSEILYQSFSTTTKNQRNSLDSSSTACSNETKEEVLVKRSTSKARIWRSDTNIKQKSIVLNIAKSGASVKRKLCDTAGKETCIENESLDWPVSKRVKQLQDEKTCSDGKYIRKKARTSQPTKLVISNTVLRRSSASLVSSVNEVDELACESVLPNDSSFDFHLDRLFGSTSLLFMRSSSQLFLQQIKKKTSIQDWLTLIGQNYFRNESGSKLFTSSSSSSSSTSCYKTHDNSSCSSCNSKYSINKESHSNMKLDIFRYIAPSPSITSMQNNSNSVVKKEYERDIDSNLCKKGRKGKKMNERMEKLRQLNKQITVADRENKSSSKKRRLKVVSVFANAVNKFGGKSKQGRCQEHLEKESSKSAEYLDDIIKKKMKRASKNYFRKTPSNGTAKLYQNTSKSSKNNHADTAAKEVMEKEINEKSGKPSETKPKLVKTLWSKWKQKSYETSSQSGDFHCIECDKQTPNSATTSEKNSSSAETTSENDDSGNVTAPTNESVTTKTIDRNKIYGNGKKKDYIKPDPDLISIGNQSNESSSYIIHNIPFRRQSLSHGSLTLNQEQENINQQFAKARKVFQPKRFDFSKLLPMKKYSSSGSHQENKTALIKIKSIATKEKPIEVYETQNEDRADSLVEENHEHRFQNIRPTSDEITISNIRSIKSESSLETLKIVGPSLSSRIRMFQKQ